MFALIGVLFVWSLWGAGARETDAMYDEEEAFWKAAQAQEKAARRADYFRQFKDDMHNRRVEKELSHLRAQEEARRLFEQESGRPPAPSDDFIEGQGYEE